MDFCWDPWQVSALACPPVWSGTADTAAPPSTGPSLGTESCQPWGRGGPDENGGVGWSRGSRQDHPGPVHRPGALGRLGNEDGGAGGRVGQVSPTCSPLPLPQRCFQTTNGYLSDSRSCSSNYNVAALATSSLVGGYRLLSPGVRVVHPGQ